MWSCIRSLKPRETNNFFGLWSNRLKGSRKEDIENWVADPLFLARTLILDVWIRNVLLQKVVFHLLCNRSPWSSAQYLRFLFFFNPSKNSLKQLIILLHGSIRISMRSNEPVIIFLDISLTKKEQIIWCKIENHWPFPVINSGCLNSLPLT